MCLRNAIPNPLPRLAPSIRPGISAITKDDEYSVSTPKFGETVVNGYAAMAGFAAVRMDKSVLFPAFGSPWSGVGRRPEIPVAPASPPPARYAHSHITRIQIREQCSLTFILS